MGGKRRDRCDDRCSLPLGRLDRRLQNRDLLGVFQGCPLAERTERDKAVASIFQQPRGVAGEEFVVDCEIRGKGRGHRRQYAKPIHREFSSISWILTSSVLRGAEHNAAIGTGNRGERTDVLRQPNNAFSAGPQTRPWHEPMPQRVWSFASVHPLCGIARACACT